MNKVKLIILSILILNSAGAFAWEIHSENDNKAAYIIINTGKSLQELDKILLNKKGTLTSITLKRLVRLKNISIQQDIVAYLKKHHPEEYEESIRSAGNKHNPALKAIQKHFETAILKSNYVSSVNNLLRTYGYVVGSVSTENFFLIKKGDDYKFDAITWLIIKKITGTSK
ncbi:hypothetical protein MNBD_GAMMA21-2904 [hydrothermal vent metagenome]|uniref:Uncharacterized protein n=1 Tax=hydrothermal vent metagenome TaxID=652676 RepID=A0A3B0ZWC8_9ZZZZ